MMRIGIERSTFVQRRLCLARGVDKLAVVVLVAVQIVGLQHVDVVGCLKADGDAPILMKSQTFA